MDLSGEVEVEVKQPDEKLAKPPSMKRPKDSRGIDNIGSLVDVPLLQITEHGTNSVLLASSHQKSAIDLGNEIMTSKLAPQTPIKCQKSQDWQPLEVVGLASEGSVNKDMSQTEAVMDKLDFCTGNGSLKSLAPLTPCKSGKVQNYEPHKNDLSEERLSEANTEKCIYVKVPSQLEQLEHHADVSLDSLSSQPWESGNDKNGGKEEVGLIKTPRKNAAKRKKHRPKVIRESKPAKSPKQEKSPLKGNCSKEKKAEAPVTPPITDKDNSTLKRVYVRRKKGLISLRTPSGAFGENMDQCCSKREKGNDGQFIMGDGKSVRRSLNFNLDSHEEDRYRASPGINKEFRAHKTFPGSNTDSCGAKFAVELTQGPEVVVNKSPLGIVFDLNCSQNEMLEEYISLPEHPITSAQHPTSDTISKELNDFGDSGNNMNIIIQIQNDQSQVNSSTHSRAIPLEDGIKEIGTKRHYTHIEDNQDLYTHGCSSDTSFMQAYKEEKESSKCQVEDALRSYFPEIYKKRRTEKGKKWQYKKAVLHNFRDLTFGDGKNRSILDILKDPELLHNYPLIRITKKRSKTATRARKENPKASTDDCNHLLRPARKPKRSVDIFGSKNYGPQTCMEALFADANFQMKTKKRTEKGRRLHLVSSMSKFVLGLTAPSGRKFLGRNLNHFQIGSILEHQHSCTNTRGSLYTSFTSPAIHPYTNEIDGVLHKLKCLNLNGDQVEATDKEENALIPYDLGSMMIPYNHLFDIIKRKRTRARVDLDPETNKLWNLLMGNQRINEDGGVGMDKEKWWEEERRIFRGRIDSFIARMHLIQGDRRFSKWKGSVVDSVVGVFLTQNVSDHLSSSAFMSLAARYPVSFGGNSKKNCSEWINISKGEEEEDESILVHSDDMKQQELMSGTKAFDFGSSGIHESENLKGKAATPEGGSLGSNKRDNALYLKGKVLHSDENDQAISPKTPSNKMYTPCTVAGITNLAEAEGRMPIKEIISSQRSALSLENSLDNLTQMAGEVPSSIESTSEADDLVINGNSDISNLLVEHILVRETINNKEPYYYHDEGMLAGNWCAVDEAASVTGKRTTVPDMFNSPRDSSTVPDMFNSPRDSSSSVTSDTLLNFADNDSKYVSPASTISHLSNISPGCGLVEAGNSDLCRERGSLPRTTSEFTNTYNAHMAEDLGSSMGQHWSVSDSKMMNLDSNISLSKQYVQMVNGSTSKNVSRVSQVQDVSTVHQNERNADIDVENFCNVVNILTQKQCNREEPECPKSCSKLNERLESSKTDESNLKDELRAERNQPEMKSSTRVKNVKAETGKKNFDWDSLRKEAFANCAEKERSSEEMDSLDWEAVRSADVDEISNAIRARGMNNVLAQRIKDFLNRLVKDHGNIDLEWLRHVPPDKAKAYLLSVRGLGLKSVECVLLLTLHHLAFPVDTNVGRVCVRLGWVPLQPLPESLQLHLLELYPMIEHIQKYLWPRLCTLDQKTLYELHYQLITFGKVFCTKSRPNCNACPMRGECKHFASAFASARLLLPGPEEKRIVTTTIPVISENERSPDFSSGPPFHLENNLHQEGSVNYNFDPIIEEPPTPEQECSRTLEGEIEDAFYEDPDDIPVIKLNLEEFTENLQNYILENSGEVEGGDISKALVAINAEAASIPMPKLKNVSRLRTEHRVYELPDSHPLLEMMDQREHNDPCPYLLAIWTPGETAQSTEPPQSCCSCQGTGELCDSNTCFSCNSAREAHAQTVRGTLLIPCRTAMRGSFPLNGTYFQVNEVFADHSSSCTPIDIPRKLIWNLPRRTVYFGTSIPTIFRGMTTEEIQLCFWRGFVCVRGFDRSRRAPKPLIARLHIAASKMANSRKMNGKEGQKNTATAI